MIQIATGVLGAVAATLALGAVHLEVGAGNGLLGPTALASKASVASAAPASSISAIPLQVSREGKGDRMRAPSGAASMTLAFTLSGAPESSVLMRIPTERVSAPPPLPTATGTPATKERKLFACEPSVSVLTSVAKELDPARCVT